MKVAELIADLQKMPQEVDVWVFAGYAGNKATLVEYSVNFNDGLPAVLIE